MTIRTFLFDFDGVLVDSMPAFISVMLRILDENGVPYGPDIVKIITPLGYGGAAAYFRKIGLDLPAETIVGLMNAYALEEYRCRIPAKKHAVEALNALKARGAELNVLTASPHAMLDVCLKRLGVFELFDNVWSCDDFGTTKADPGIYRRAAQRLGRPVGEILFLDDNLHSLAAAKESGIRTCGVYDDSSADCAEDIRRVADDYICDLSELLKK